MSVIPDTQEAQMGGLQTIVMTLSEKQAKSKRTGSMVKVIECFVVNTKL
jgi:hypothetical protein